MKKVGNEIQFFNSKFNFDATLQGSLKVQATAEGKHLQMDQWLKKAIHL